MGRALLAAAVVAALAGAAVQAVQRAGAEGRSHRRSPARHHAARARHERRVAAVEHLSARELIRRIDHLRRATWHWQTVVGDHRTPSSQSVRSTASRGYRIWVLTLWRRRAAQAWTRAKRPPHKRQWLCIHRYEGAWNDPDAPYYGGLQMDSGFQQTYGAYLLRTKGTADHWTPLEQMWVAERAHKARGFYPWPNTARTCGLL
jgi:hypothetical protein